MTVEIYDSSNVWGTIIVTPNNVMSGKYNIIAIGESELTSHFHVRAYKQEDVRASLLPRVIGKKELNASFDVKYKGNLDLHSNILAYENNFLDGHFEVRPHGSMMGVFDIIEPPKITENLSPIQDSTVRSSDENRYINYGSYSTMMIGNSIENEYLGAYVKFRLEDYPETLTILNGKLRIYYTANIDEGVVELYSISKDWDEYGVTYANRPLLTELISNEYTINREKKYIEFDVLDYVQSIVSNGVENYGFGLRTNNNKSYSLYARESQFKPQLTITYFDTRILSLGRADLKGTIFIYGTGRSDLHGFLDVKQHYNKSDLASTLYIHRYEDPLFNYQYGFLNTTKPELHATLVAVQLGDSDLRSRLRVRKERREDREAFIGISTPDLTSTMYTRHHDNIDAFLVVRAYEENDRNGKVFISTPDLFSTLYTIPTNDLNSYITIQQNVNEEFYGHIGVSKPELSSTLYARYRDDLIGYITIQQNNLVEVDSYIGVSQPEIKAEMYVKYRDDLIGTLGVKAYGEKDLVSHLFVNTPELNGTILIKEFDDLDSYIKIRQSDDCEINSFISVSTPDLHSTMITKVQTSIDATLTVNVPELNAGILIRAYGDSHLEATLLPRVIGASDLHCTFDTLNRHRSGAYYYII